MAIAQSDVCCSVGRPSLPGLGPADVGSRPSWRERSPALCCLLFTKEGMWCLRDLGPCEITASTLRWEPRMMRICKGLAGQCSQVERGRLS